MMEQVSSVLPASRCSSRRLLSSGGNRRARRQTPAGQRSFASCTAAPADRDQSGTSQQQTGSAEHQVQPPPVQTSQLSRSPWELMGRVVREDRLAVQFNEQLNQGLVRSAAARASGLEYEEFETRLQRLLYLMPFLQPRLLRIQPKLLAALAADPDLIAARLIELKALLPAADVAAVAGQRPSLLLAGEWERVPDAVRQLLALYSEEEAARLATAEPVLLADDVEEVLAELGRLLPQQDARATLLQQPSLASNVSRLSHLSLW